MATLRRLQELEDEKRKTATSTSQTAFEKYKAEYPDEAAVLEAKYTPLELAQQQASKELQQLREETRAMQQEFTLQRNTAMVLRTHPDATDIIADPLFNAWVDALDEDDRARAESLDAKDAIKTLEQFKRDKMLAELLNSRETNPQPAAPSRKQPKLDVEPTTRNRQSPVKQTAGNAFGSEEEAWAAFVEASEADPNFGKARR